MVVNNWYIIMVSIVAMSAAEILYHIINSAGGICFRSGRAPRADEALFHELLHHYLSKIAIKGMQCSISSRSQWPTLSMLLLVYAGGTASRDSVHSGGFCGQDTSRSEEENLHSAPQRLRLRLWER